MFFSEPWNVIRFLHKKGNAANILIVTKLCVTLREGCYVVELPWCIERLCLNLEPIFKADKLRGYHLTVDSYGVKPIVANVLIYSNILIIYNIDESDNKQGRGHFSQI